MKVTKKKDLFKTIEQRGTNYVVSFGYKELNDEQGQWEEITFDHKPSVEEIKMYVNAYYNGMTQEAILKGMRYGGGFVWLSSENQQNYLAAYNMAFMAKESNVPQQPIDGEEEVKPSTTPFDYTIKLTSKDGVDFYHTFETAESYISFYRQVTDYINFQVKKGWELKDAVNYDLYEA